MAGKTNSQSLLERFGENTVPLFNYMTSDKTRAKSPQVTGRAIDLCKVKNLAVLRINMDDKLDESEISEIFSELGDLLTGDDIISGLSSELLIWCNIDEFPLKKNLHQSCYKCKYFSIDLISGVNNIKSLVCLPGTRVRNAQRKIIKHEFYENDMNSIVTRSIEDVVKSLGIAIKINDDVRPCVNHLNIIDLKDSFDLKSLREKAEKNLYKNDAEVIDDLMRVMRFVEGTMLFVVKEMKAQDDRYVYSYKTRSQAKDLFDSITCWKEGQKNITVWSIMMDQNTSHFSKKGIRFHSSNKDYISTFDGYKYPGDKFDPIHIDHFTKFAKEVISAEIIDVCNFIIKWYAYIYQNPGEKTEAVLVLKGLPGTGKTVFCNILCELLAGYSSRNITD